MHPSGYSWMFAFNRAYIMGEGALYKNKADYQQKIERRLNQLIADGWFVPACKSLALADAAKGSFED
jgi:hypothetical protein